jgi:hypothetical protein
MTTPDSWIEVQFWYAEQAFHKDYICDHWSQSLRFPALPSVGQAISMSQGKFRIASIMWLDDDGIDDGKAICVIDLDTLEIEKSEVAKYVSWEIKYQPGKCRDVSPATEEEHE